MINYGCLIIELITIHKDIAPTIKNLNVNVKNVYVIMLIFYKQRQICMSVGMF